MSYEKLIVFLLISPIPWRRQLHRNQSNLFLQSCILCKYGVINKYVVFKASIWVYEAISRYRKNNNKVHRLEMFYILLLVELEFKNNFLYFKHFLQPNVFLNFGEPYCDRAKQICFKPRSQLLRKLKPVSFLNLPDSLGGQNISELILRNTFYFVCRFKIFDRRKWNLKFNITRVTNIVWRICAIWKLPKTNVENKLESLQNCNQNKSWIKYLVSFSFVLFACIFSIWQLILW